MNNRRIQIGFSQRIQLEWLEYTANLLLAGYSREQIKTALNEFLRDKLSVNSRAKWGSRGKTISNLMRIWVNLPDELIPLRDEGLKLLQELPAKQRLAVHWGMCLAVYPFFAAVAETVGRLLRLQNNIALAQVMRRIREIYGQRETINRPTQRLMRNFVDWKILRDTDTKGVYEANSPLPINHPRLSVWLLEALLHGRESYSYPLTTALQSPQLFPFTITTPSRTAIQVNERLAIYRQALDEDVVSLSRNSS